MALQLRRVTEQQRTVATFIPVEGEPVYVYDTNRLYIGDGATPGGIDVTGINNLADYLGVDFGEEGVPDGAFIYYSDAEDSWKIGQPTIYTSDLADVTPSPDLDLDFMIAYDASTSKWVIQERLTKPINEVEGFDIALPYGENRVLLEYDESSGLFKGVTVPTAPDPSELLGVTSEKPYARGHILLYDENNETFRNDYILEDGAEVNISNIYGQKNKDIISYGENGFWGVKTPFLTDIDIIGIEGYVNPEEEEPITIVVSLSNQGRFLLDGTERFSPTLYTNKKYIFDLSDPLLLGKTFRISAKYDGTHDETGEIIEEGITITGTEGVDGVLEVSPFAFNPGQALFYFCVEEPELGAQIFAEVDGKGVYVMQWDSELGAYDPKKFNYNLNDLENVFVDRDENGLIRDKQTLVWDAGNKTWWTPGNMIPGVTGELGRRQELFTAAIWIGNVRGVGSFEIYMEEGTEIDSMTVEDEEGEEYDIYLFDDEQQQQEFFDKLNQLVQDAAGVLAALADEWRKLEAGVDLRRFGRTGSPRQQPDGTSRIAVPRNCPALCEAPRMGKQFAGNARQ